MPEHEPTTTYLELRASTETGAAGAGLSHTAEGLVLLHVLEHAAAGEPRGAVTIVHDAGEHGGRYLGLAHELARRGFAVALPDLRGHGRSEGERGHSNGLNEVMRDLTDVQDHLAYRQPEAPKVLVGHGLGALYALAFALENKGTLAALALVSPLVEPRFAPPPPKGGLMKLFSKKPVPTTPWSIGWSAADLSSDPARAGERSADELRHDTITLRAVEEATAAAAACAPRVGEAGIPTLVVHGAADPIQAVARVRAFADGRDAVRVEVLDGARHDPVHEPGHAAVESLIGAWLEREALGT
jgi:alpha-beta hydrolase superfamily lysophospholipase